MQWDDVRYFLVLARDGSLSAASRTLRVEHSTVSRRVDALERDLGVRLFDRLPRGWVLSWEGKDLVEVAQRIEAEALALERAAAGRSTPAGKIRISAPPVIVSHFLVPHLRALQDLHPDLDVELLAERRGANLVRGEADVALRVGQPEVPEGLVVRSLGWVGYGFYGTKAQVARAHPQQVFIGFDDSMQGSAQKTWLDQQVGSRRIATRSNELFVIHRAARSGLGIALLPHLAVERGDGLVPLDVSTEAPLERPFSLLVHPDVRRSPRVRAVTDFLATLARAQAGALRGAAWPPRRARR